MSEAKKRAAPRWRGDWSVFWIPGGFVLTYFIYIPTTRDECIPFPGYSMWLMAQFRNNFDLETVLKTSTQAENAS